MYFNEQFTVFFPETRCWRQPSAPPGFTPPRFPRTQRGKPRVQSIAGITNERPSLHQTSVWIATRD